MKLHNSLSNADCIGKGCCTSIGLDQSWVSYSDAQWDEKGELLQEEGHYRDVYVNEGSLLAYCDGEYCQIAGYDEDLQTVTLTNDNDTDNDRGRSLCTSGDNAFTFTISFEQFQADFSSFFTMELNTNSDSNDIAEIICRKCKSSVFKSENPNYAYQCKICDEDLYGFETEQRPPLIVEGSKEDTGFMGLGYADEGCSHCMDITYNIPTDRVSLCAHCRKELFPCAGCEDGADGICTWDSHNQRCDRFNHSKAVSA